MALKVLAISTSPRRNGNTDALLNEAVRGAVDAGAETEFLYASKMNIAPCVECSACFKTGKCRVMDDYQVAFEKMLAADRIIFATPIFFMTVCAQAKLLMDRCQCLWARKYVLKQPACPDGPEDRRALVIAVGGSASKKMFDCVRMPVKYFLDSLDVHYSFNLFINRLDEKGEAGNNPSAMKEAYRLGRELVEGEKPTGAKPVDVEIYMDRSGENPRL